MERIKLASDGNAPTSALDLANSELLIEQLDLRKQE
jgi:hypothetical protein